MPGVCSTKSRPWAVEFPALFSVGSYTVVNVFAPLPTKSRDGACSLTVAMRQPWNFDVTIPLPKLFTGSAV
jgi:hypothetical protein